METSSKGRGGRPWRRVRARILAASDICWLCGQPGSTSVDHIVPLSLGGHPTDPANLAPAHISCNSRRGNGAPKKRQRIPTSRDW